MHRNLNVRTYKAIMIIQYLVETRIPAPLATCWSQAPVTLENVLGQIFLLPLELIKLWELRNICT